MQVGTLAVQHLFEKDVHYEVPLYQRPYVWTETEQWQPLWEDLQALAELIAAGKPARAHFMGASVQDLTKVAPGQIETRLLIDGQQRLTTLQLLIRAFADVVKARGNAAYSFALDKLVTNNHPLITEARKRYKIWPTNADRESFELVMTAPDRQAIFKAFGVPTANKRVKRSIPDAYLYFREQIEGWLEADPTLADLRIAGLYSAIRDNLRLVVIDLDEKDDAQMIFETLNARGTPLLSADLVKNSLLNEAESEGANAEAVYKKYWQKFDDDSGFWRELVGRGHAQRARIETFLQHTLTLLSGEIVSAGHLYNAYRDYAKNGAAGMATDRLAKFRTYGDIFKRLQGTHADLRLSDFYYRLQVLDVVTAWPFILALYERNEDAPETIKAVLGDLESYLVRRMVCRLSTRGYGSIFASLTSALVAGTGEVAHVVRSALQAGTAEVDRWPTDAEFRHAFTTYPLYENLTRPRMRFLLEAMEQATRSKFAETSAVPLGLTIEHIMPQGWRSHWPLPEGTHADDRDRLVQTIGNLTLLNKKFNPYQSNRPWVDGASPENGKRANLEAHSVLFLNKSLCLHAAWSDGDIGQRAADLFVFALLVWPRPAA